MERLVKNSNRCLRSGRLTVLFLTLLFMSLATVGESAPPVTVTLDPPSFAVDQSATLTITINDARGSIAELPEIEGLLLQNQRQSRQQQIVIGPQSSSVYSFSTMFEVYASQPGTFTIPAIPVMIDGQRVLTEALTVEITPAAADSQTTADLEQLAFLRISPVKAENYLGELLPVEIKAYFRQGLRASLNSQPRLNGEGFVLTQPMEPLQTQEMVNNIPYAVLTWPGALSGIKEGQHALSIGIDATLLLPSANRQRRLATNDPFFGNDIFAEFFNQQQMQEKKIQIVSKEMNLQVLPLPVEGRPADFQGAIGSFALQVQAQPVEVGPGDPITLTMTVEGTGNFELLKAPVLTEAEGWKSYQPAAKFTPGARPGQGSKVFEQAIIAKNSDKTAIPPVVFSFFNPESGVYQTVQSDPIALHGQDQNSKSQDKPLLSHGLDSEAGRQQPEAMESHKEPETALHLGPLRAQLGALQQQINPLFTRLSFQIVVLLSVLLLVALTLLKIRVNLQAANPALSRQQEMTRLLELRLQEMKHTREQGDVPNFLAACRKAMQEQLGLLWQTEPEAITLADLRQHLAEEAPLLTIFATAESSAYIGSTLSSQEMADYAAQVERELRQLR